MREPRVAELTGKAGEHAVAAQLLLRDVVPFWPSVDRGCDLITENYCRLQVKSAHLYHHKNGPRYFFPLPKMRRVPNSDTTAKLIARKSFVESCDFVIFWGIEQNRFWIVPATLCDQVVGVELGIESTQRRFVGSIADMREMKALGYSNYKIAKHYGIQQCSVKQFLASGKDIINETVVSQMRACEGRWESILDFKNPAFVQEPLANGEVVGGIGGQAEGSKE
jgi:hypothetical protein